MTSRTFTLEDQLAFAALSGDFNPLHVDPLAARRTPFGRPVVHGVHLLLWALAQTGAGPLTRLSVLFRNPVCIGDLVSIRQEKARITLHTGAAEAVRIQAEYGGVEAVAPPGIAAEQGAPRLVTQDMMAGLSGSLPLSFDARAGAALTHGGVPPWQAAILLATTRLVGMECPGLYSLYSELTVDFTVPPDQSGARLDWRVTESDPRFSRVTIDFAAPGAKGAIQAFLRPSPQPQASSSSLRAHISADRFSQRKALVVGGSRGLGELCAKMLAAGGAQVRLTYHTGAQDAARVVEDIVASGGEAGALSYDILNPPDLAQALQGWTPTHVYYFPTPAIFVAQRKKFSAPLFAGFCRYYVDGFYACWEGVRAITRAPLHLMYPSSVAVEDIPPDMAEYAAAKAAGENLCRFLAANDKALNLRVVRLPRLPSDQTASIMQVETADPVAVLLDALAPQA